MPEDTRQTTDIASVSLGGRASLRSSGETLVIEHAPKSGGWTTVARAAFPVLAVIGILLFLADQFSLSIVDPLFASGSNAAYAFVLVPLFVSMAFRDRDERSATLSRTGSENMRWLRVDLDTFNVSGIPSDEARFRIRRVGEWLKGRGVRDDGGSGEWALTIENGGEVTALRLDIPEHGAHRLASVVRGFTGRPCTVIDTIGRPLHPADARA